MNNYRTLEDVTFEYFSNHPEEIDDFLQESFAEYAKDGDSVALLTQLRIIARVMGISDIAKDFGMTGDGLQNAFSEEGYLPFDNINGILHAMGYVLMPQKINS